MMKNIFILCFSLAFFSCSKDVNPPNIILFLVDDLGWQDTSIPFWDQPTHFNERYHTPNMERLAREGMKFTQAYATSVCSPTRVSLMTGMNAARHRVTNWTLHKDNIQPMESDHPTLEFPMWNVNGITPDPSIKNAIHATTLPLILNKNGYRTIHVGKAHFGAVGTPAANPINIGFDVNIAGHAAGGLGSYHGKRNFSAEWRGGASTWDVPGLEKYHGSSTNLTEALTIEAMDALDNALESNKPFFLYMSHYTVHAPIEADDRFLQKYLDAGLHPTEAKYASMVEGMDQSLGDLMNYLAVNDLEKNTIILFMSDNGGLSAVERGGEKHTHNWPLSSGRDLPAKGAYVSP
jgi:arylsulfatase A-like enzyme